MDSHGGRVGAWSDRVGAAVLAAGALAAAFIAVTAVVMAAGSEATALDVVVMVVAASVFTLTGVLAWRRRPGNRCGMLMMGTGLSFALAGLSDSDIEPLEIVGDLAQTLPLAAVLHLLIAYPSGRVSSALSRAVVGTGYLVAVGLQIPRVLVGSVHGPLHVGDAPPATGPFEVAQALLGIILYVAAIVILVVRVRVSSPAVRRAIGPLRWLGPLILGVAAAGAVLNDFLVQSTRPSAAVVIQLVAVIGLPIAFLIGLVRGAFGRTGELRELLEGIDAASIGHDELRALLARTLGDESLRVLYRREDSDGFVDETGVVASSDPARRRVDVALQGSVAGALDFDPTMTDIDLVAEVARIAALALARQRLTVELRASVHDLETTAEALREAQGRIVAATDRERRRIAGDLHDGAQQRIVALGLQAQQIARSAGVSEATAEQLRWLTSGLGSVVDELRALVRGIMPTALIERGLEAATRALADRAPIPVSLDARGLDDRLPPAIESTAYFVVAESLTNTLKHARSAYVEVAVKRDRDRLIVEVRDGGLGGADMAAGAGLRGLDDRVSALGGQFDVGDRPDGGTVVRAELPCVL